MNASHHCLSRLFRPRLAVVLVALMVAATLGLGGCGTSTRSVTSGDYEVHTFRRDYNNAHLLVRGENAILVDAGLHQSADELIQQIIEEGFDPTRIRALVITHGHADHAGGANIFKQKYGTPIIAGAGDKAMLARGTNDTLCPVDSIGEDQLEEHQHARYLATQADQWVTGPMSLADVAGFEAQVVPLPSHTPGSLAVIAGDIAIVGDVFRGAIVGSSAELHFYQCDLAANRRDIRRLLEEYAPNAKTFFVGHFGPVDREDVEDLLKEEW